MAHDIPFAASHRATGHQGGHVLAPTAPLSLDTEYHVHYLEHCTDGSQSSPDAASVEHDVVFRTTPTEVALPTSIGEITVRTTTGTADLPTNSSCGGTTPVRAVVAELVLHPSAAFHAVVPVAVVTSSIAGNALLRDRFHSYRSSVDR